MTEIALIPLYNSGRFTCVDLADLHLVLGHTWWEWSNNRTSRYAYTTVEGRTVKLHQLLASGEQETDHINRNGLDNRRVNLRQCTHIQNSLNRVRRKSTLGLTGVDFDSRRKRYGARLYVDGLTIALGYFHSAFEAALVRDRAMTEWAGDFAEYNYK